MSTKATPQDMKDLQFVAEQFNGVTDFDAFLQGVIDGQEALLTGRIGATIYGSSDTVIAAMVKQASISLTAAELLQRRVVRLSGNVDERTVPIIQALRAAQKDHSADAEDNIARLIVKGNQADSADDFAGGATVSSHFDGCDSYVWPGGLN